MLQRLKRVKYGGAEAEFGEKLEEVEEEISELPAPATLLPEVEPSLKGLGSFSHNSAVFISWLEVEFGNLESGKIGEIVGT